ncbi:MAG: hypothetical protein IPG72_12265 [Ardenticatenales bacterium]|nr:hypothetical protein [Ardenticatenales bacterium]
MPTTLATAVAVAATVLIAIAPGLALLRVCGAGPRDVVARVGVAAGVGLAVVPVVYLWAATIGVGIGPVTWGVVLLGAMVAGAGTLRPPAPATLALVLVLFVQLIARWYAARTIAIPVWADSVHHTMIADLFVRHHGLPADWLPLAPLSTFSYHFGFHSIVAAVASLTGIEVHRAVIVVGQTLMVLQALTVAGLTTLLTGRRWAGVAAAVVVGGLGPMPGTYLTWGRYTQLAGQVVLPAALGMAVLAAREPCRLAADDDTLGRRRAVGRMIAAAVIVAGLALTHYVVLVFFVVAVGAWWLVDGGAGWAQRRASFGRLVVVALAAVVLALPWLPRFLAGNLDRNAAALVSTELPGAVWGAVTLAYVVEHFGQWVGVGLTAVTGIALAVGLARRDRTVAVATVWIIGLVAASYPQAFGLAITGPLKDFTVLIGLYVPAALAIGAAAALTLDILSAGSLPQHWGRDRLAKSAREGARGTATTVGIAASVALAAVLGYRQRDVIQPDRIIATPADERALAWVRDHTPADAVFLASGQPTYGDTVVLGEDGGWWLPVLADRACTIPPLPIGHELTVEPDYRQRTVDLAKAVAADLGAPDTVARLQREGVEWAYVGPTAKTLTAGKLEAAGWRMVYDEDGASVWVAAWGGGSGGEGLGPPPVDQAP